MPRSVLLLVLAAAGCGDDARPPADARPDAVRPDAGPCGTTVDGYPLAAGVHVAVCSPIDHATNPPTSGEHYPYWARYKSYPAPVPRGFWVHDLEHGAVVVTYNCPDGCADDVAALEAYLAARPADPSCAAPVANRFVVTPDPLLDTRFAASAWGFALRSSCFDLDALGTFIDDHYGQAPEDLCADGIDPLDPQNGFPDPCPP